MSAQGVVRCPCGKVLAVQLNSQSVEVIHRKRASLFEVPAGQGKVTIACHGCSLETIVRVGGTAG